MKFHLGHFLGLSAIVLAMAAAFFSVTGLGQLFAGATLSVIIMASTLEFSKIIIATFLHKYWGEITRSLKIYLTIAVVILVSITSAGIYGFLSSAYQHTANDLQIHNNQINLIDNKISLIKDKIGNNDKLVASKLNRYDKLMELRSIQEVRLDSMINRRYFANANKTREEIERADKEMKGLQVAVDEINTQTSSLNDSINKFQITKMELASTSDVAAEIGPLKYISELTGQTMDVIVNYFTLLLIFVFDPLAISLVVATNWVFERERKKREPKKKVVKKTKPEKVEEPIDDDKGVSSEFIKMDGSVESETVEDSVTRFPLKDGDVVVELKDSEPEVEVQDINEIEVIEPEEVVKEKPSEEPKIVMKKSKEGPYSTQKDRGFSTPIPEPKSNKVRLGTNKFLDGKEVLYKKNKDDKNK